MIWKPKTCEVKLRRKDAESHCNEKSISYDDEKIEINIFK